MTAEPLTVEPHPERVRLVFTQTDGQAKEMRVPAGTTLFDCASWNGIASGSMITSSGGIPWSPAAETIFFAISSRRCGSIGISSSFASAITAAP